MNCIELFSAQQREKSEQPALWMPDKGVITFSDLKSLAERTQRLCRRKKIKPGESVLLFEGIGPRLYASILGLLGIGVSVVLVEPWMKINDIQKIIDQVKPKLFLTNSLGKLWGLRIPSVRSIPNWAGTHTLKRESPGSGFHLEQVPDDTPGVMVFTSGTSGNPKGIVRRHGSLVHQQEIITRELLLDRFQGPDLNIFANFVLLNLALGRCSVIVPHKWPKSVLRKIDSLPSKLQPETLTCGPAFLDRLADCARIKRLRSIHVGGALSDCRVFEKGFKKWPEAHWLLVYGSSEAEPVSISDARTAVEQSRKRNYLQTLFLGGPVPELSFSLEKESVWVTGPHVCPMYLANEEANRLYKRRDEKDRVWHFMGDRILADEAGWWFAGRSEQRLEDFQLEQKIYSLVDSSESFVFRDSRERLFLLGKNLKPHQDRILKEHNEIQGVIDARVYRDKRHRAKIDRGLSVRKGASWIAG